MRKLLILLCFLSACTATRFAPLSDEELKTKLRQHISILASDEFEGRETGTPGADKAMNYITDQFKRLGLKPKGDKKFLQEFSIPTSATVGRSTQLYINTSVFRTGEDFFPMPFSGNGNFIGYVIYVGYGIYAPHLQHDDYLSKGNLNKKIFVMESTFPDNNPQGKFREYDMRQRVDYARSRGATAVIFINSDSSIADPKPDYSLYTDTTSIPVIFARKEAARMLKYSIVTNCLVGVELLWKEKKAYNIIGYINNKSDKTVVIGAHYDGRGMESDGEKIVHNGANDNASGVAGIIELARYLRGQKNRKSNYLFIAFSGFYQGTRGSAYFITHNTSPTKINYLLNLDMVGNLQQGLSYYGQKSSTAWQGVVEASKGTLTLVPLQRQMDSLNRYVFISDEKPFFNQKIPALLLTTGQHAEGSDNENKINYDGEVRILRFAQRLIDNLDSTELKYSEFRQ